MCAISAAHNTKSRSPPPPPCTTLQLLSLLVGSPAGRVHRAGWDPQHHAQLLHRQAAHFLTESWLTDLYICRDPPRRGQLVDILKPIWAEDDSPPTRWSPGFVVDAVYCLKVQRLSSGRKFWRKAAAEAPSWNKQSELGDISVVGLERMRWEWMRVSKVGWLQWRWASGEEKL